MDRLHNFVRSAPVYFLAILALPFSAAPAMANPTGAVVLDGSFGTSGALTGPNYQVTSSMGLLRGNNLFQSFSTFNLVAGESATFSGPANVQNILARVTGGSESMINGSINSSITGANLFFINPAGVVFGPNASVNVGGSFTVSTANYVKFSDGGVFYAQLGQNDEFTSAPVSAFGFLGSQPAAVQFFGSALSVNPTLSLNVMAGDITADAAVLSAPSGNLTLFSAAGAGEVSFSLASPGAGLAQATNSSFGHVTVEDGAFAKIDGSGGGHVVIRGGRLTVDDGEISSGNSGSVAGGDISIQANHVAIQNGGIVLSTATGAGQAGDISVQADDVTVDGTAAAEGQETGILSIANASGAGSINVAATGAVSLLNGGEINASTTGPGGNISIHAGSLVIDDSAGSDQITGIAAETFGATSTAGALVLVDVAGHVAITSGGTILSFSFAPADAASVQMHAGSFTVDGEGSSFFTGIESEVNNTGSVGAVTVNIDGALAMHGGGELTTTSFSSAGSGNIAVQAGSVEISGALTDNYSTGIETVALGSGAGGNVSVTGAGAMEVGVSGTVNSVTFSSGTAGTVAVQALSLDVDGGTISSGSLESGGAPSTGNGGAVTITIGEALTIEAGGLISSAAGSIGQAGSVSVAAGSLTIDGTGAGDFFTGIANQSLHGAQGDAGNVVVNVAGSLTILSNGDISSNTFSSGHGGNVQVNAGSLAIGGDIGGSFTTGISANSNTGATGHGGTVTVDVADDATVTDSGQVSTTTFTTGNGGALALNVGGMLSVTNGGEVSAGTAAGGASGGVTVHASSILVDGSGTPSTQTGISSQSNSGATGDAGPVLVEVDGTLVIGAGGEISSGTRSTGNAGNVTVQAGSLIIENAAGIPHLTGITSETDGTVDGQNNPTGLGGDAGSIDIDIAGALTITSGKIDTDTFCLGSAGDIRVHAGSISIDGAALSVGLTGIFSDSNGFAGDVAGVGGNAGTVTVAVDGTVSLTNRGAIGAATYTSGLGGSVNVSASSLVIDGASTGITAQAFGSGDGGGITFNGGNVSIANSGLITASASHSNAGTIDISATSSVSLTNGGTISTEASMDGGNITLNVGNLVYVAYSQIIAAAGNNGGNVTIDPQFVVLDHALISANAAQGQGGNITIITDNFLNNLASITATGVTDGTINITAPVLDLSGDLVPLEGALVSNENRLRENCAKSINHEFSSLIAVGRGGSESAPNELQPDIGY